MKHQAEQFNLPIGDDLALVGERQSAPQCTDCHQTAFLPDGARCEACSTLHRQFTAEADALQLRLA